LKINADGTGLVPFAGTSESRCGSPQWSPDGKFVAFDTWPAEKSNLTQIIQIAVVRADGTDLRLIGHGAMPSWSPDSTQIVCHTNDNPQTMVVLNVDGTGRETITNHWGSPRWTRRRNRIASIHNSNIALYDPATGREHLILPAAYSANYGFSVSPDGLRFCFGSFEKGLYLATLDERTMKTDVRPLVKDGSYHHSSFSPDGKRIVFSRPLAGAKNSLLHVVDADGKSPPVLLPGQEHKKFNCDPTWSPDGKTIVFASEDAEP